MTVDQAIEWVAIGPRITRTEVRLKNEAAMDALSAEVIRLRRDCFRVDWLDENVVDTIYLDDGRIVDVRGLDVRKSIDEAMVKWPEPPLHLDEMGIECAP